MSMVPAGVAAMPPPVEVTPLVASADPGLESEVAELIAAAGRDGHFAATAADPALVPNRCALDAPERDRCLAGAARATAVENLVFVVVSPGEESSSLACIANDPARAQQTVISLDEANGSDAMARLRQRSALAGCIIGALHAPPRG